MQTTRRSEAPRSWVNCWLNKLLIHFRRGWGLELNEGMHLNASRILKVVGNQRDALEPIRDCSPGKSPTSQTFYVYIKGSIYLI